MKQELLTTEEVMERLKIGRTVFYQIRPKLIALGLKAVRVGKFKRYLESSLDKVILTMAEMEN